MTPNNHDKWDRLCKLAEQEMRTHHIPGASLGVSFGGDTLSAGFGVTNLDNPLPVEPTTLFQIGSITKTFTCAAVMRHVEANRLQLQTPVTDLLPTWRVADSAATSRATVWNLLTHTGGWLGDLFIDTGPGEDALAKYTSRMAELPQVAPIGLHFSYNNAAFALLGHLLELVETKPFEQIISESLFGPAALAHCFFKADDVMARRFAVGHRVQGDSAGVATPWALPRCVAPMGGIVADVLDLLSFARLMLDVGKTRDGTQLLKAETVQAMQTPQLGIWHDREAIGLAWHLERHGGEAFVQHGGATLGQGAYLEYCPTRAFALAILANSDTAGHMVRSIRKHALRQYLGVHLPEDEFHPMTTQQMKEVEGRYVLPKLGFTEIRILAGKLIGQDVNTGGFPTEDTPPEPSPPPYTLELTEPDRLVIADGKYKDTICHILRDDSGQMRWFRMGGRIHLREPISEY
jgi:CubicO group peptidase (beta-lactamase class C family)